MEIWLDSLNEDLIVQAVEMGLLFGVTTNPSILADSPNIDSTISTLLNSQPGPITYQLTANNSTEMIGQAKTIHAISDRIIIKVPVTQEGLKTIHQLSQMRIPTMATVIFDYRQYLLAAKAGALYAAPYYSSIVKAGGNADQEILRMCQIKKQYGFSTKILAASLHTLQQFDACADLNVDAITLKDALFHKLIQDHPFTIERVQIFEEAWKSKQTIFCN